MKRVSVKEAASRLNMTVLTVQVLLREERLPIGMAVKNPKSSRFHYIIYDEMLERYVRHVESGGQDQTVVGCG